MASLTMFEQQTSPKPMGRGNDGLHDSTTENTNVASEGFDTKSALEIARIINHEDAKVAAAVKKALPEIAIVIDIVARSLRDGGRLIYVGAGSSGTHRGAGCFGVPALVLDRCPRRCSTSWRAARRRWRRPRM